jgi:hypothetical protein
MSTIRLEAVASLGGLFCDAPIPLPGIKVGDYTLCTDKKEIERLAMSGPEGYAQYRELGTLHDALKDGRNAICLMTKRSGQGSIDKSRARDLSTDWARWLWIVGSWFSHSAWLKRDNCLGMYDAVVVITDEGEGKRTRFDPRTTFTYFNAQGSWSESVFTRDELEWTADATIRLMNELDNIPQSLFQDSKNTALLKRRKNRVWHLIHTARQEHLLPYRIVHYVTALERLLSRDNAELSHKIAERGALLL